jgi:hypothetical protein
MDIESNVDLTSQMNGMMEESVSRRYEINALLTNIYGEHAVRTQVISHDVFDVSDVKTSDDETAIKQTSEKKKLKRSSPREVHTFPKDTENNLLIPLGGSHGYLMGAIKTAIPDLFKDRTRDSSWEGYGIGKAIEHGVIVKPEWFSIGKIFSNPISEPKCHLVKINGISATMVPVFYDTISSVNAKFNIDFTNNKIPESIFLKLLAHTQLLGLSPKGRGSIKYTSVIKTKG